MNADAIVGFRRVEVLTGPARRRRWSSSEKSRVVAETLLPGASVSEVARRWQVCSQQVFTWRREARAGRLALPSDVTDLKEEPSFVPLVPDPQLTPAGEDTTGTMPERVAKPVSAPVIEIKLAGAMVRVAVGTDCTLLADVLRAVRASAA